MVRKIIKIDEEKCNGCGQCASACHEGAIDIVDGKARLVRENFCDGFGDCLPGCPTGAISFEEREAPEYDEDAVAAAKQNHGTQNHGTQNHGTQNHQNTEEQKMTEKEMRMMQEMQAHAAHEGSENAKAFSGSKQPLATCPGSRFMMLNRSQEHAGENQNGTDAQNPHTAPATSNAQTANTPVSRLSQWPVQIKLLPTQAPFYDGAKLLIAADCTAYAYAAFHEDFIKGHITLVGCPKLDDIDYTEKLTDIIAGNNIKSVTIVRMEVPCCGGLQRAAEQALQASGKFIPWQVVVISRDGRILEE